MMYHAAVSFVFRSLSWRLISTFREINNNLDASVHASVDQEQRVLVVRSDDATTLKPQRWSRGQSEIARPIQRLNVAEVEMGDISAGWLGTSTDETNDRHEGRRGSLRDVTVVRVQYKVAAAGRTVNWAPRPGQPTS